MTKKMTRRDALLFAINAIFDVYGKLESGTEEEGTFAIQDDEANEVITILEKMIAAIDKQAARPKTKSSARVQNESMAKEFISLLRTYRKPVNTKWVCEHIRYCATSQKAVAVAAVAEEWGAIERVTIKGRTYYELVDNWRPEN